MHKERKGTQRRRNKTSSDTLKVEIDETSMTTTTTTTILDDRESHVRAPFIGDLGGAGRVKTKATPGDNSHYSEGESALEPRLHAR